MPRFPLYAKILSWFFLNLVLLAAVFFLVVRAQFGLGLDWFLSGGAAERIDAVSRLILSELTERPGPEWNEALQRFATAYRVHFFLFGPAGEQLAGEDVVLPAEVKARLVEQPKSIRHVRAPKQRQRPPPPAAEGITPPPPPPSPGPPHQVPPAHLSAEEAYTKFLIRTPRPTRYWMCVRTVLSGPDQSPDRPVTLVAMSSALSAGGLLLDPKPWLMAGLGAVFLSALLWFPFVRGITRCIGQMTQATRKIADGQFEVRVDEQRRDELGALGSAVNQMAARLGGFVTGQKRFLGDIAHELCSPLARLQVALGILDQRAADPEKRYVQAACEKADQISTLVNELLSFSKASLGASSIKLQPVHLRQAVQQALHRENNLAGVRLEVPEDLEVLAEPSLLVGSVSNLVRNAVRYAGQAGPITVRARREKDRVIVTVEDHGPGIPEEHLAHVFDPFYRVDASRNRATGGVGLGLTLVKTCIESCEGTVTCRNRNPHGLEVTIRLRCLEEAS
ncbi:MAG: ATP-binding protein [Verrucomicrobiia bacterium]